MNNQIEILRKTRNYVLTFIEDLSIEQLNEIPAGFNNNIIWNVGHIIAAQQGVAYFRAGLPMHIDKEFFLAFKPDSKPEQFINTEKVDEIKQLLVSTMDQFEIDYQNNTFGHYKTWTTRYGVEISNIHEALNFLPYHEGLHLGYIMALKRLVKNKSKI